MIVEKLGLIDYEKALEIQLERHAMVVEKRGEQTLLFCSHPSVVTLGRGTKPEDVFSWQGATLEVSRGGRATYHGPSQVVVYPILDLNIEGRNFLKPKDLSSYLRLLEKIILKTLHDTGLSEARVIETAKDESNKKIGLEMTGVWVGSKKIASIGIAVKQWVTYHGIAINLEHDPLAFTGINPCGFQPGSTTSVEKELGLRLNRKEFENKLEINFQTELK